MKRIKFELILVSITILFASCASTTIIQTNIPEASVFLNGAKVGSTPYAMTDTKIVGSRTSVKLEKEGYTPLNTSITRDEQVDVGALIGGLFVYVPFLWTMKYNPTHYYELVPLEEYIPSNTSTSTGSYKQLRELKKLLDDKIITEEEFLIEKKKLLND